VKTQPKVGANVDERRLSPDQFLQLVRFMPKKAVKLPAKTMSSEVPTDAAMPEWIPAKWKKGWFAVELSHVAGKVETEDAESALLQLLEREDGLEEYGNWLLSRLARPRDAWTGFAQHFGGAGFFKGVFEKKSGRFLEIACGGKASPLDQERAKLRVSLLSNISFSSGIGSELHVSDAYVFSLFSANKQMDIKQELITWLKSGENRSKLTSKSNRGSLTRQLVVLAFTKVAPAIKNALDTFTNEMIDGWTREMSSEAKISRLADENARSSEQRTALDRDLQRLNAEIQSLVNEKQRIEDKGSDADRKSRDLFDRLRLSVADDIERLLKVALEVAKTVDDSKKSGILVKQVEQILSLGEDLRDATKATKRAGG
jgi:hypothetical protein